MKRKIDRDASGGQREGVGSHIASGKERYLPTASVGKIFPTDADRTEGAGRLPPVAARDRTERSEREQVRCSSMLPESAGHRDYEVTEYLETYRSPGYGKQLYMD